jgi:hypothetical protein
VELQSGRRPKDFAGLQHIGCHMAAKHSPSFYHKLTDFKTKSCRGVTLLPRKPPETQDNCGKGKRSVAISETIECALNHPW